MEVGISHRENVETQKSAGPLPEPMSMCGLRVAYAFSVADLDSFELGTFWLR